MFFNIFGSLLWFILTCLGTMATFGLWEDEEFLLGSIVGLVTLASWSLMATLIISGLQGLM